MSALLAAFGTGVRHRLDDLNQAVRACGLDPAIDLIVSSLQRGVEVPPLCISANVPGGDAHNDAVKARNGEGIAGLT